MAHKQPELNEQTIINLAKKVFGLSNILEVKELMSNYDRNYYIKTLHKPLSQSGNDSTTTSTEFVMKILNTLDSQHPISILAEIETMEFLQSKGFPCPKVYPAKNNKSQLMACVDLHAANRESGDKMMNDKEKLEKDISIVRLIQFLNGSMVLSLKRNPEIMYTVGLFVGSVSRVLKDFSHAGITFRTAQHFKWNLLEFLDDIEKYITVFDEHEEEFKLIRQAHQLFVTEVKPHIQTFRTGTVHNDLNGENLLMTHPPYKVTGLLDFGHLVDSVLISDLSNSIAYFLKGDRGVELSGYILAGYQSIFPLPANERNLLYYFVLARLCQLVMYLKENFLHDPERVDIQICLKNYCEALKDFWERGKDGVEKIWQNHIKDLPQRS